MTRVRGGKNVGRLIGAGAGLALLLGSAAAPPGARAASGDCSVSDEVTTCVYELTGASQEFVVPDEVRSVLITAAGGQGALYNPSHFYPGSPDEYDRASGGLGDFVQVAVPVTPGESLQVTVGGAGFKAIGGFNGGAAGGAPGRSGNGYAVSRTGGGGGGASDVRTGACATTLSCPLDRRIVVAGGGGGYGQTLDEQEVYPGGAAYSAGQGGNYAGKAGQAEYGGTGGRADLSPPVCSRALGGGKGAPGAGGAGGEGSDNPNGFGGGGGGGGGGGWYGGGGGAGGECYGGQSTGGGGGGGGSSYGPVYMKRAAFNVGNGAVAISYGGDVAQLPKTPRVSLPFRLPRFFDAGEPVEVDFKVNMDALVDAKVYKLVDGKEQRLFLYQTIRAEKGNNVARISAIQDLPIGVPLFVRFSPRTAEEPHIPGDPVETRRFTIRSPAASRKPGHRKHGRKRKRERRGD